MVRDPVCGMEVSDTGARPQYDYQGNRYSFCSSHCLHAFQENPSAFIGKNMGEMPGSRRKAIASGIAGAGGLVFIFFGIVTVSNGSLASALDEFRRIWFWIALLAGGFGLQLGLFVHLRSVVRGRMAGATAELAASGTISTGSMVACCSHALVNLLPILGISAAAAFLARYQDPLLLLGVVSNLLGLSIMLGLFQRHQLLPAEGILNRMNMKKARLVLVAAGMAAIGYSVSIAG